MKANKKVLKAAICTIILLILILDTETAIDGAKEGIKLSINVLLPSLFPFFIVTTYMNAILMGQQVSGIEKLCRLLHIPPGCESILLIGLIGGYPVGAQLLGDMYRQDYIDKKTGHIMLGYCNNAGPAFIFGVTYSIFSDTFLPFCLWGVHLLAAILTGILLPKPKQVSQAVHVQSTITIVQAFKRSIQICSSVCGWVIVFKIVQAYLEKWIFLQRNKYFPIILSGILELSTGCLQLTKIECEAIRFVLCAAFLAFGGVCVTLQTLTATESLGLGLYLPGKLIQTCISMLLSTSLIYLLFPANSITIYLTVLIIAICVLLIAVIRKYAEKSCGNFEEHHI